MPKFFAIFIVLLKITCLKITCANITIENNAVDNSNPQNNQISATWHSRTEARSLSLSIPAPRGQIVDRNGKALATNKLGYYLAIKLPFNSKQSKDEIITYANFRLNLANQSLDRNWKISDEKIWEHYIHRRWLAMPFTNILSKNELKKAKDIVGNGLELYPMYYRTYPQGKAAAHIIGYVGKKTSIPTGPIERAEPLWELTEGREGLEKYFDEQLVGKEGNIQLLYDENGKLQRKTITNPAVSGDTIVSTLDIDIQKIAESVLRRKAKRGAFVLLNSNTGEIIAMASWPTFNPNKFIPSISVDEFKSLVENPSLPLYPRAFRGAYPPASTFKILIALASLEAGSINKYTTFNCTNSISIGNLKMRNWNTSGEGTMAVVSAIKRSCNTWFIRAALRTGGKTISSMAEKLGFGQKTGISLNNEASGYLPEIRYKGDIANFSIGQGKLLATPLQVARLMACIARGSNLKKVSLVKQLQKINNNIYTVQNQNILKNAYFQSSNIETIVRGMRNVIYASDGTGKKASNSYGITAGKTGTGQWKPNKKQNIAWFAGFIPANIPEYSYAALYEGSPYEKVSGGKKAAPIVASFFNRLKTLKNERKRQFKEYQRKKANEAKKIQKNLLAKQEKLGKNLRENDKKDNKAEEEKKNDENSYNQETIDNSIVKAKILKAKPVQKIPNEVIFKAKNFQEEIPPLQQEKNYEDSIRQNALKITKKNNRIIINETQLNFNNNYDEAQALPENPEE